MTGYRQLAIRYLLYNKKRSFYTVLGVALSVVILFTIMNFTVSYIITERDALRKVTDYEASFLCKDRLTSDKLTSESCLKSAYVEQTLNPTGDSPVYIVYANFNNPYRLLHYAEEISRKYQVEYKVSGLATYYLQDMDNDVIYTTLLTVLLITFIFAVLGVGIIRNSIQLITLEQGRHYGILRCIGATVGQLKNIIYLMGLFLEMVGIVLGTILGFFVYLIPAKVFEVKIGFHPIILPFILIAFLGDFYFVMQENCSLVNKITPVAALNGHLNLKVNREKIKAGRGKLIEKLLGFEWSYAYKSLMRNPSRFFKTVGAVGLGVAMVIVSFTTNQSVNTFLTASSKHYGYYQIYGFTTIGSFMSASVYDWEKTGAEAEAICELEKSSVITSSVPVYAAALHTADSMELSKHYTEAYSEDSYFATMEKQQMKALEENQEKELSWIFQLRCSEIPLYGYGEENYNSLKRELKDGTMELSKNGILLVNHNYSPSIRTDLYGNIMMDYETTDYQIGDKITFVDFQCFQILLNQRMQKKAVGISGIELYKEYLKNCYEIYSELLDKGATRTYIIEGILSRDPVLDGIQTDRVHFVLPLDRYLQDTGLTENQISGQMFHMKGIRPDTELKDFYEAYSSEMYDGDGTEDKQFWCDMTYIDEVQNIDRFKDVILTAVYFTLFIVGINILNIINITAGNLYSRRMEFAQLRFLGMSAKRLRETVLLEGVITGLAANAAGLILGAGISRLVVWFMNLMIYVEYHFQWAAFFGASAVVFLIISGSVYRNFMDLPQDIMSEISED